MDVFSATQKFMEEAGQLNDIGFPEDFDAPKRVLRRRMLTDPKHGEVAEYLDGELRNSSREIADGLSDTIVVAYGGILDYFGVEAAEHHVKDVAVRAMTICETNYGWGLGLSEDYTRAARKHVRSTVTAYSGAYLAAEKYSDDRRVSAYLGKLIEVCYYGMLTYFGEDVTTSILTAVWESNLAKKWEDGTYHKDSFGKVIKPPNWQDPGEKITAILVDAELISK